MPTGIPALAGTIEHMVYDGLAGEYYDTTAHPHCADLRTAGMLLVERWAAHLGETALEVGAGSSVLAELPAQPLYVIVSDYSPAMLAHTTSPEASKLITDVYALALKDESVDSVVAVLGSAFNTLELWTQVGRVLRPGGYVIFTAPAPEFVEQNRANRPPDSAGLKTSSDLVSIHSRIPDPATQVLEAAAGGLVAVEHAVVYGHALISPVSQRAARGGPVTHGWLFRKPIVAAH